MLQKNEVISVQIIPKETQKKKGKFRNSFIQREYISIMSSY